MDLYNASNGFEHEEEIPLTLEEYEDAKTHLQKIRDRAECAKRLAKNDDFKALFIEGYLTDKPKQLAELMASGRLHEKNMEGCMRELDSIGRARNYFKEHLEQGQLAIEELQALEEAREAAILAEEEAQANA